MGIPFHESVYGKRFFDGQLPSLIKALNRLADVKEAEAKLPIQEVSKSANTMFICYEENSHELATENGAVNQMYVAASLEDVHRWVDDRLKAAEKDFYTVLNAEEQTAFREELLESGDSALVLYHNGDEDSRLFYALTVKPVASSGCIFQKANSKTRDRLCAVMSDAEKSEKFGEVFCEQVVSDDEKMQRIGFYLAKAILDNSVEDLLVAVCGWTSESLLNIADYGTAYPEEK